MASKLTPPAGERALRALSLITFIPALVLLIVSGVVGDVVLSFILFIPLFFTLFSSLAYIYIRRVERKNHGLDDEPKGFRRFIKKVCTTWLWPVTDLVHALTYLGLLVGVWVNTTQHSNYRYYWYRSSSETMLITYATVFPLFNMFSHFYFAIVGIFFWLRSLRPSEPRICTHCGHPQNQIRRVGPSMTTKTVGGGATYSLLGERSYEYDGDAGRASMESGPSEPRVSEETADNKV